VLSLILGADALLADAAVDQMLDGKQKSEALAHYGSAQAAGKAEAAATEYRKAFTTACAQDKRGDDDDDTP